MTQARTSKAAPTIGTAADANLFFFMPRAEESQRLVTGLRSNLLPDNFSKLLLPSVVVGGISRDGKLRKGATVVPSLITDSPMFDRYSKLIRASVIDQDVGGKKPRKVLVSHKEGNDWIVLVRTGFQFGQQGMMGDYMNLLSKGVVLKPHGSYNFDRKNGAFLIAEGREEKADFGSTAAERIGSIAGRKIKALGYSPVNFDMWRIPEGAVVIVRDVDSQMMRLIGGKSGVVVADAKGYDKFFDTLLDADLEERAQKAMIAKSTPTDINYKGGVDIGNDKAVQA